MFHALTWVSSSPVPELKRGLDLPDARSGYQRVVGPDHVITFGAHSIALPALPSKRGYAGNTVDLSHRLDGRLLVSYRKLLLLSLPWPLPVQDLAHARPALRLPAQKPKTPMPRIYHLGGRPALAAVT